MIWERDRNPYEAYYRRRKEAKLEAWLPIKLRINTPPSPIYSTPNGERGAATLLWRIFFKYPAASEEEVIAHRAYLVYAYRKIRKYVTNQYIHSRLMDVGHGR